MKAKYLTILTIAAMSACSEPQSVENQTLNPVRVRTISVGKSSNAENLTFSATIEETNSTPLSFAGAGTVKKVYVADGEFVGSGKLIAELDAQSVIETYEIAKATLAQAQDAYDRMKQLYDKGSLSEMQWVEVQTKYRQAVASEKISKKNLTDTKLYAPVSGYVFQKNIEEGQNAAPGVSVMKIVKIDQVKAKISVPESEVAMYAKGDKISIEIPALGNKVFSGTIVEKSISADPVSRTYGIKALIGNPTKELLPGMIGNVLFSKDAQVKEITIPANIVQIDSDNRTFVWRVENGVSQKTYITVDGSRGQQIAVSEGLSDGDIVISDGSHKVCQGTKVEIINR